EEPVIIPPVITEEKKIIEKQEIKENEPKTNDKKPFYKKWWFWLLLLGILFVILFFVFFCCNGNPHLPDREREIPPIDTTKIVEDPNGKAVISNQLILYIGSRDKTVEELVTDFKDLYPSDDYKVIYYNTEGAKRINIEFPESEKEKLKKKLNDELSEYNLVIVDEAIYNNNLTPPDPGFSDNHKNWSYQAVKVYSAWDKTEGNPDIIVAIIDDGFDLGHPEFEGKIVKPFNIPAGNKKPNTADGRMIHGTHVAATAIGNVGNAQGLCGIAPRCAFMPIQVGDRNGNMSTTAIIDAIFYAIDNGADVVNMSLGVPAMPGIANLSIQEQEEIIRNTYLEEEDLWNKIFKVAYDNNVTFVLAGGNDDALIGLDAMQRTPYTINVSAINPLNRKANFSNYGRLSTISAPGVEIYSALPDKNFGFLQGTSMAAPMVTGGVALLKSVNPDLTTQEIVQILQETGVPIDEPVKIVGNLMQLSVALGASEDSSRFIVDCPEIQKQIDSMLNEIEKLKNECYNSDSSENLIIPDDPKDFKFAAGVWKSTTDLFNTTSGEKVELYFEFNHDGTGEVTYLEVDGNKCYSDLSLSIDNKSFEFAQLDEALCDDSKRYMVHTFVCKSVDNDIAKCTASASNGSKVIEFMLERVR
ncbi:MAG: S8 family serine peptidase, partial [Bacteroidota bacterium]|nr:S8 family serine peptidase [Bacteroidota bacterium]